MKPKKLEIILFAICVLVIVCLVATAPPQKRAAQPPEHEILTRWQQMLDQQHEFLERQLLHTHEPRDQHEVYIQLQNNVMMRNMVNLKLERLEKNP